MSRLCGEIRRLAWLAVVLPALACGAPAPPEPGPIVLITIDTLRADVVSALGGPPGLTPGIDSLAAEADWVERAVSTSSWTVPSMASIFTGLQPFRHGNWDSDHPVLGEELETLPEALQRAGYETRAFRTNRWLSERNGYARGFDGFGGLGSGKNAQRFLGSLDGGRQFAWIHILPPHAPYIRHAYLLSRLAEAAGAGHPWILPPDAELPEKIRPQELEPYRDPAVDLPGEVRDRAFTLYLLHTAYADRQVEELLEAVRSSGQWERTTIVVTSDHGEAFGESGQVLHAGALVRPLVEVPLIVKLPTGVTIPVAPRPHVSNHRLFSTLLELAGIEPPDGAAPSLLGSRDEPALSELYHGNGVNEFSLVEDGRQLRWRSFFSAPHPDYYAVRLKALGDGEDSRSREEAAAAVSAILREAFLKAPPLDGSLEAPELELVAWDPSGDPGGADVLAELAHALRQEWLDRNGEDLPPGQLDARPAAPAMDAEERERLRALGYVVD